MELIFDLVNPKRDFARTFMATDLAARCRQAAKSKIEPYSYEV